MLGKDQTCGSCAFFVAEDKKNGVCRIHPPALIFLGMKPGNPPSPIRISMWPETQTSQWCGDHRPKDAN